MGSLISSDGDCKHLEILLLIFFEAVLCLVDLNSSKRKQVRFYRINALFKRGYTSREKVIP